MVMNIFPVILIFWYFLGLLIPKTRDSPDCPKAIALDPFKLYVLAVLAWIFWAVLAVLDALAVFAILAVLAVMADLAVLAVLT